MNLTPVIGIVDEEVLSDLKTTERIVPHGHVAAMKKTQSISLDVRVSLDENIPMDSIDQIGEAIVYESIDLIESILPNNEFKVYLNIRNTGDSGYFKLELFVNKYLSRENWFYLQKKE